MKNKISFSTIVSVIISILPFGVYYSLYSQMPSQIPIHYNANGVIDRFVDKSSYEILLMCGIGILGFIIMKTLSLIIIKLSDSAKQNNSKIIGLIMDITTLLVTILFTGISIYFLVTAANIYKFDTLEIFKLSNVFSGIIAIVLGNYLPKFKQSKLSGFRTKTTLSNKEIWFKTQRFCGRVWIIGGVLIIICSFLLGHMSFAVSVALAPIAYTLMIIIPAIYSKKISEVN